MKCIYKCLICLFLVPMSIQAQTKLASVFGDNMVLQQQEKVSIWGMDLPNSKITIITSWGIKSIIKADENGLWSAKLKTKEASFNSENIKIKGSETIVINNVLIGEVWLCSGQSNMDMPMNGLGKSKIVNSEYYLKKSINKNIRLFNKPRAASIQPSLEMGGKWEESNKESAKKFSAIGYLFALELFDKLNVPIGIIETAWGGTRIEAWLPKEYLIKYKDVKIPNKLHQDQKKQKKPSFLYNAMIHPFQDFKIKGVLWYQGESNRTKPKPYYNLMLDLIHSWREQWNDKRLPFYFVQIAPYNYVKHKKGKINFANFIREAQFKISETIKNTGLVVTTDLGDCNDIHPSKKAKVAKRLSKWALNREYNFNKIQHKGATFKSMKIVDNRAILNFKFFKKDFFTANQTIRGFSIAGDDKVFYPASVSVNKDRKSLTVYHKNVAKPVAVRYGFSSCFESNLQTQSNLPLSIFRTDSW